MVTQPHPYRCETCKNENCDLSNINLEKAEKTNTDVGKIRTMILLRRATEIHGCCSHSQHESAEQRIADVIKELEETICKTDELYTMDFTGDAYNSLRDHTKKAIALLREGK